MNISDMSSQVKGSGFHIFKLNQFDFNNLISMLKEGISSNGYIAIIDGNTISDKNKLLQSFSEALAFPNYFGYNWDAFEECINDLEWLDASSYIIVLKNPENMNIGAHDHQILLEILNNASRAWMEGRQHNARFSTNPTPFHIILAVDQGQIGRVKKILGSSGIKEVDVLE